MHIYIYIYYTLTAKDPKQQGLVGSGTCTPHEITCPVKPRSVVWRSTLWGSQG